MKVRKHIYGVANLKGNYNSPGYCFRSRNTAVDSSENRRHVWWILYFKRHKDTTRTDFYCKRVTLCYWRQ